jgi:hypothetical protein
MTMPIRHIPFTPGPTCTCTPPDKNDWKVTQFTQGIKTIKCEKCGKSWNESDPGNDPVWSQYGMY